MDNSSGTVSIDPNGITVTDMDLTISRSDNKSRVKINGTDGIKIQSSANGAAWTDRLSADTNGNLILTGNLTTGTGTSAVRADTNGFYIGSSTFSNAKVRITPTGNATFAGALAASSVSLTGGNMGWGNFNVDSSGNIVANNATLSGNITANAVAAYTFINAPNINGGTITGTTVQTQSSGYYPRTVISSTDNLLGAYKDANNYIAIMPDFLGAPGLVFNFKNGVTSTNSNLFSTSSGMGISTKDLSIAANSVKINNDPVATHTWVTESVVAKWG